MGYILKVDTTSKTHAKKSVFICCANRFRAKRALKSVCEVLADAPVDTVRAVLCPTLMSERVYKRLSFTMEASRE